MYKIYLTLKKNLHTEIPAPNDWTLCEYGYSLTFTKVHYYKMFMMFIYKALLLGNILLMKYLELQHVIQSFFIVIYLRLVGLNTITLPELSLISLQ